ncbi:MAG: hypothetical protein JXR83_12185 [Deltaproteobacteria bacterium]|nr:hypothetical protein [Deltaproteobacteria bacterium]
MTTGWMKVALPGALLAAALALADDDAPELFAVSDQCLACHNGLTDRAGYEVSIGSAWRPTMMAQSARDPYWQAGVRRETLDLPALQAAIENECATCHMPMARAEQRSVGQQQPIFAALAAARGREPARRDALAVDGVACSACHQIENARLGEPASFNGGFTVAALSPPAARAVFGPFDVDTGRQRVMRSATGYRPTRAPHVRSSELCATCHTLFTHALGTKGEVLGTLPEQVPYLEWKHSDYREAQSCQDCHMPAVAGPSPISSVLGQPRQPVLQHLFRGANFLVPVLLNQQRGDLGVTAPAAELTLAQRHDVEHLQSSAAALTVHCGPIADGVLTATVGVENRAGHKLPSAYPSRRAWLHVVVRDGSGVAVFESGALTADGAIVGNDNDNDNAAFEPHHRRIETPDQVQIYETIMGRPDGSVTTGLLSATQYLKDNRVLPSGFDKVTAPSDVAVRGDAANDPDFEGGRDLVRYAVAVVKSGGPYQVQAELWYQPIGYRWAHNLAAYDAVETRRFVAAYRASSAVSAALVTRAVADCR